MFGKEPTTLRGKNTKIFRYARVLSNISRHRFLPAHLRRATTRIAVRIPTEPFSPTGWFAVGTVSRCHGRGCWQAVRSAGSPFLLRQLHPPLGLLVQQLVELVVTFAPFGEVFGRAFAHRHFLFENLLLDFHVGDVGLQGF